MATEPTPDEANQAASKSPITHAFGEVSAEDSTEVMTPRQQRRKAGQLLQWIQWLLILILIGMMVWMLLSQQRFEQEVLTRVQNSEQVSTRLNEMDDRLYSISQQTLPTQPQPAGSQAHNQLEMLRIQLQAADRLLADSNYKAVVSLLRGLLWQLSQDSNEIAPALTIVIKQSLEQDIERLQAQSTQPSPWQLQNLAIADIQAFLRAQVATKETASQRQNPKQVRKPAQNVQQLATYDVLVHETIMTLNLAMQASNMRDNSLLLMYLQQAKAQLQPLKDMNNGGANAGTGPLADSAKSTRNLSQRPANGASVDSTEAIELDDLATMQDALNWLNKLMADPPKQTTLVTTQVLDSAKAPIKK